MRVAQTKMSFEQKSDEELSFPFKWLFFLRKRSFIENKFQLSCHLTVSCRENKLIRVACTAMLKSYVNEILNVHNKVQARSCSNLVQKTRTIKLVFLC